MILTATQTATLQRLAQVHPCYSEQAQRSRGRIHLPVASRCNLGCLYCERAVGPQARLVEAPGAAARILSPEEAALLVDQVAAQGWLSVVGIAGPGEPLFCWQTFEALRLVRRSHPELLLCLSTNGLLLPETLDELLECGVSALTVTINAVVPDTAERLYQWAELDGSRQPGRIAAPAILERQWTGLGRATEAGMLVKVNSVLVPGVNGLELREVARRAGRLGVARHNIMPLIPRGRMRHLPVPDHAMVEQVRTECGRYLTQFRGCRQCRADAIAPPLGLREGVCCGGTAATER